MPKQLDYFAMAVALSKSLQTELLRQDGEQAVNTLPEPSSPNITLPLPDQVLLEERNTWSLEEQILALVGPDCYFTLYQEVTHTGSTNTVQYTLAAFLGLHDSRRTQEHNADTWKEAAEALLKDICGWLDAEEKKLDKVAP